MTDFIQARCPECNRLLAECCEGSRIRTVCNRCKKMVSGAVIKGKFVATARTHKPEVKKTAVASPPMLTG